MAHVVVVEDTPDSMKLFRALLERHGYQVTTLASGEALLDTIRVVRPAAVLLDIQLPDRDGYELLGDLRAEFGRELTVVALTAHGLIADREQAMAAGFDGFITKPIDVRAFPDQVAEAIRGREAGA